MKTIISQKYPLTLRSALASDAARLGRLHYECARIQPDGFMHKLGKRFLVKYYETLLTHDKSIVVYGEDPIYGIVGMASGTLEEAEELATLRRNRLALGLATMPEIFLRPWLILQVMQRNEILTDTNSEKKFIVRSGPRISYWCWKSGLPIKNESIKVLKFLLDTMRARGVLRVKFEVDAINKKVIYTHKLMGAKIVERFMTSDERERLVMEYGLIDRHEHGPDTAGTCGRKNIDSFP